MRAILLAIAQLLLASTVLAQPVSGPEHDVFTSVARTPDGRYLAGGLTSSSGEGETDAVLCMLSAEGELDWLQSIGGESWDETAAVAVGSDDSCYLAGSTRDDRNDNFDWLVARYSIDGVLEWSSTFILEVNATVTSMAPDNNGGVYVTGLVIDQGRQELAVLHLGSDGTDLWTYAGNHDDHSVTRSVTVGPSGDLFLCGELKTNTEEASNIVVTSISGDAELDFEREYPNPLAQYSNDLEVAADGSILVCGSTIADSASEQSDARLIKFDSDGDLLWDVIHPAPANDSYNDLCLLPGDSVLVCGVETTPGSFQRRAVLRLYTPDGELSWTRYYGTGHHAEFTAVDAAGSGEFMAVGFADLSEARHADYFLATATTLNVLRPSTLPVNRSLRIYPNPGNAQMSLQLTLARPENLTITIYNLLGQRVAQVSQGHYTAGSHRVPLLVDDLASGNYMLQIRSQTQPLSLTRFTVVK